MEFGHISKDQLDGIDFTLPPDSVFTLDTLSSSTSKGQTKIYTGASKWGEKGWLGQIYPLKTPEKQLLTEYAKHFDTVELSPTFYKIPTEQQIEGWVSKVAENADFRFCPKFPQAISHMRRFTNVDSITDQFYDSFKHFKGNLGPAFVQLPDNGGFKIYEAVKTYLEKLPTTHQVFVEVRNEKWFSEQNHRDNIFCLLKQLKMGAVISDTAGRRDAVHMELPIPKAFVRFVGNDLHPTDFKRIDDWVERIASWQELGLEELWFFVHSNNERHVPALVEYLKRKLGTLNA